MDWTTILYGLPISILGVLNADQWKTLVNGHQTGIVHEIRNNMGGKSSIDSIADGYLLAHPTAGSAIEARLLADSSIALISTVNVQGTKDSELSFYTADWHKTEASFSRPSAQDFYTPSDSIDAETFRHLAQPALIGLRFTSDGEIEATFEPEQFLPQEFYQRIRLGLRSEPITLPLK